MRKETQDKRKAEIEIAAYELLEEKGYSGTSMLNVAKRARASNETLYRWYGDKRGLFLSMVHNNASETKRVLENAIADEEDPSKTLDKAAPILLTMLLGQRAISLNRAAAADPSYELGRAISNGGKEVVAPLFALVIGRLLQANGNTTMTIENAVALYFGLLIGDRQIRRAIGVVPEPSPDEIEKIYQLANENFLRHLA